MPTAAEVDCRQDRAVALTPLVRPLPDGIHVVFHNLGGFGQYFFPTATESVSSDLGHGGPLARGGPTEAVTFDGPGPFLAGCLLHGESADPGSPRFATIEAVDPQELFTPDLTCAPGRRGVYRRVGSPTDLESVVRTIPGVQPDDQIRRPGYPEQGWMVEPRVVIRDGSVVARILLWGPSPAEGAVDAAIWKLWVDACPGSGIGGVDLPR